MKWTFRIIAHILHRTKSSCWVNLHDQMACVWFEYCVWLIHSVNRRQFHISVAVVNISRSGLNYAIQVQIGRLVRWLPWESIEKKKNKICRKISNERNYYLPQHMINPFRMYDGFNKTLCIWNHLGVHVSMLYLRL